MPDGVHPNAVGHDSIAKVIYRAISAGPTAVMLAPSKAHGVFAEPRISGDKKALSAGLSGSAHLYSLDGKSRPRPGTPLSAGAYVIRAR